jgi:FKBP-type peptidyl-prolyl cis-trans isomerase
LRASRGGLLLGCIALLAGCGGEVANTTSGTQPATSTTTGNQSAAPTCNDYGIDSSITDRGADDRFAEGAGVAGTVLPDGLKIVDLKQGTGAVVKSGQCLSLQYTGWTTDGKQFDSSRTKVGGFVVTIGTGKVIAGWDEGVPGTKVGGRRRLEIPPALGYGASGQGSIPPNATLIFIVEVLKAT